MSQIYCKKGFKLQLNQNSFNLNFFKNFFGTPVGSLTDLKLIYF